jgi:hypothetical protein
MHSYHVLLHRFPLAVEYSIKPICEVTHGPPERAEINKLVMMVVGPRYFGCPARPVGLRASAE